ncbi:MAG: hypothetical protein HWE39_09680 [Oceanospirillaceae bacterium]|nr:hypothetical protein [Oceanospirillaceae bacterium]
MKLYSASLLIGLTLAAPLALAEITGNVSLTSDYRVKGISQTGENPALQGGIDYVHESGFYSGVWGSNVDFFEAGDPWDNDESVEIDVYGGYYGVVNDGLTYDVTLFHYFYPGSIVDVDFSEISIGANLGAARVEYSYAHDYINIGEDYQYLEANYTFALPAKFNLELHAGYSYGSFFDDPAISFLEEYADYSLSLSRNVAGIDVALAYIDTNIDSPYAIDNDFLSNQDTVILSFTKSL